MAVSFDPTPIPFYQVLALGFSFELKIPLKLETLVGFIGIILVAAAFWFFRRTRFESGRRVFGQTVS